MKASIIVSDTNSQGYLLASVICLCNQDFPRSEYEILFPDYGNFTKEEKSVLEDFEKEYSNFRLIKGSVNRCSLINKAVKLAKADLILFTESHCLVGRKWVSQYVDAFKSMRVQVAEGPTKLIPDDTFTGQAEVYSRLISEGKMKNLGFSHFNLHNSAIRKGLFIEMNGLDENFDLGEYEFSARLRQRGIELYKLKDATVWHSANAGLEAYPERIEEEGSDRTKMLLKHGKKFMEENFPSPTFIKFLPVMIFFRIPLLLATKFLIIISLIGFKVGIIFNLKQVTNFYFHIIDVNSHRYGKLKALRYNK